MNKATLNVLALILLASTWVRAVDLSHVPQIHETRPGQRFPVLAE